NRPACRGTSRPRCNREPAPGYWENSRPAVGKWPSADGTGQFAHGLCRDTCQESSSKRVINAKPRERKGKTQTGLPGTIGRFKDLKKPSPCRKTNHEAALGSVFARDRRSFSRRPRSLGTRRGKAIERLGDINDLRGRE